MCGFSPQAKGSRPLMHPIRESIVHRALLAQTGNLITEHRSSSSGNGGRRDFFPLFMPPPSPFKHAPPVTTQISRYRAASSLASHEFAGMELHPNPLTLGIQPFPLWFRVLQFQFCRLAVMENFWSFLPLPLPLYCQIERQ